MEWHSDSLYHIMVLYKRSVRSCVALSARADATLRTAPRRAPLCCASAFLCKRSVRSCVALSARADATLLVRLCPKEIQRITAACRGVIYHALPGVVSVFMPGGDAECSSGGLK